VTTVDLLVAGAGPVGLVTAIHARLAGLDVVVADPREGTIDKACGEGLMPDALARLGRIGVDPSGMPFRGIRYLDDTHSAEARFRSGPGRGVRRTELHDALRARADDLGVVFVRQRVADVHQTIGHVDAGGMRARYLVGADGLHSTVRRAVGLVAQSRGPRRFGVRQHFHVPPWTDLVEVHWLPDAEVYVTPVSPGTVGVAVLGGRPLSLATAIASSRALARCLSGAAAASDERGAGPLRQATSARTRGRVLLVGDAAGYVDALTGEGMRVGFVEAEAAVQAVLREDPASYERQWTGITRSYRVLTNGLVWGAGTPSLRRWIVPAASAVPAVFGRIVDSLAD
jgi:flavin-dependent dehydrogenase